MIIIMMTIVVATTVVFVVVHDVVNIDCLFWFCSS